MAGRPADNKDIVHGTTDVEMSKLEHGHHVRDIEQVSPNLSKSQDCARPVSQAQNSTSFLDTRPSRPTSHNNNAGQDDGAARGEEPGQELIVKHNSAEAVEVDHPYEDDPDGPDACPTFSSIARSTLSSLTSADDTEPSLLTEKLGGAVSTNTDAEMAILIERGIAKSKPSRRQWHKILPTEILETILYAVDPDTFASLSLVDRRWRRASDATHLYAHHLSQCPSHLISGLPVNTGIWADYTLPHLKTLLAHECKRNLFEVYMQPQRTLVKIISTTTNSSAAFPRGEAFDFSFSANGRWTLGLSSSRIYVIDTGSPTIRVTRELQVRRRPAAAVILDDGKLLAVLSNNQRVNLYDLNSSKAHLLQTIKLENTAHAIALSTHGDILATAFDSGIELCPLASLRTEYESRSIKCDRVDCLSFSADGTMILGTTRGSKNPDTVVLSAPFFSQGDEASQRSDQLGQIWASQIIIPHSSRDCSHATLLSSRSDGESNSWTFTFDRVFESFRAVRTDDLRNGSTYFTGPRRSRRAGSVQSRSKFHPSTLPASSQSGDLVAAGFLGKDIWLYGVPQGLDNASFGGADDTNSDTRPSTPASAPRSPARSIQLGEVSEASQTPKWHILIDKHRNTFAKGRLLADIPGASAICWVNEERQQLTRSLRERLIVAAPGGVAIPSDVDEDGVASVDGGRLIVFDFNLRARDGGFMEIVLEAGTTTPETLEEETIDLDIEVEFARRRTIRYDSRRASTVAQALAMPSPTDLSSMPYIPSDTVSTETGYEALALNSRNQGSVSSSDSAPYIAAGVNSSELSVDEATATFDGPYSQIHPRSRNSIYRSSNAVASNRERHSHRLSQASAIPGRFRQPGDPRELPHESDADNWVPPPPPYQAEAEVPLPDHLRQSMTSRPIVTIPVRRRESQERPQRASTMYETNSRRSPSSNTLHSQSNHNSMPNRAQRPARRLGSLPATVPSSPQSYGESSFIPRPQTFSFGDEMNDPALPQRRTNLASARRPISEYVSIFTQSLRKKRSTTSLRNASTSSDDIPPVPQLSPRPQTATSPSSPSQAGQSSSPITLTGANLQQRLEYPLPPAPFGGTAESPLLTNSSPSSLEDLPDMPSAAQLSNLNDRYRQPPPRQQRRQVSPSLTSSGDRIPAPPPGALGAAGSPTHLGSLTISSHSFSTPSLPRPRPRRLDTIDSVTSSILSRRQSRSRSRAGLRSAGSGTRSRSVGPSINLDRVPTNPTEVPPRRKWSLGLGASGGSGSNAGKNQSKKTRKNSAAIATQLSLVDGPGRPESRENGHEDEKELKCLVM